jgi:hypothetical protein
MRKRNRPTPKRSAHRRSDRKPTPAERLEGRSKRSIVLVSLTLVAAAISAVIVVGSAVINVGRWYGGTFDWRDHEYDQLTRLHAGFTRKAFGATLGTVVFDRQSSDGRFREETFRGREFWAQIVSQRDGTVVLYAVTACGKHFHPSVKVPGEQVNYPTASVRLGVSPFASVLRSEASMATRLDFFGTVATANQHLHEILEGGNPTNYKAYIGGLNDICDSWYHDDSRYVRDAHIPSSTVQSYRGSVRRAPAWAMRFRGTVPVNTYAETAPQFSLRRLQNAFQIGADPSLTRTATDPDARLPAP